MADASLIEHETTLTASGRGHLVVYLFLIALAGPASDVATGQAQPTWLAALALGAFVACFVLVVETAHHWRGGPAQPLTPARRRLQGIFVFALAPIAVATTLAFGSTWLVLFIFVTITTALTIRLSWAPRAIVAVAATVVAVELVLGWSVAGAATAASWALSTLMAGFVALLLRRRALLIRELSVAQGEVARLAAIDAVTEERLRFARDLHDLLGHSLSVIALKAELARRLLERQASATQVQAEVTDIEQIARRALEEVREAVSGYRAHSLAAELDRARAALGVAGIAAQIAVSETPLPSFLDDLVAWVVREATTNIVRHSSAHHAEIEVSIDRGEARVEVRDDGVGANLETVASPAAGGHVNSGSGLVGLRERLAEAGGSLTAGGAAGGGFEVVAVVPLAAPAARDARETRAPAPKRTVAP